MDDQRHGESDSGQSDSGHQAVHREDSSAFPPPWYRSDDWWAVWIGGLLLFACLGAVLGVAVDDAPVHNPLKPHLAKLGTWEASPLECFQSQDGGLLPGVLGVFLVSLAAFGAGASAMGRRFRPFAAGFCAVFLLAVLAFVLAGRRVIAQYHLEYVLWALLVGLVISTFWFGQRVLRIESPSLNMVISADMPLFIKAVGMSSVLGGAWIGGTIDSTGAVVAAGAILGDDARDVAATVKMIQNVLIGVVAFFVAVYWVFRVERPADGIRPSAWEIWYRFPKFILGFIGASVAFSLLIAALSDGQAVVNSSIDVSKTLRAWFFCFGFVSIGLQSDFRELASHLKGGKPLILYVLGQSFNLCLTLLMAWLMFEKVFPHVTEILQR